MENGGNEVCGEKRQKAGIGSIVASHYNKLEEKGISHRKESRIYHMRNFNNWIKSMLIQEFVDRILKTKENDEDRRFNVLDIGCGKGGDLMKWGKYPVGHMVGVDIADTSIQQCKERYNINKGRQRGRPMFSSEFYAADCTKTDIKELYQDPSIEFDIVSCQFAFHYCFESYSQAVTMLKNITSNLKHGGYFVGTTPCSYEIMSRLGKSGGREFGNSVYSISFPKDCFIDPPALFGGQYMFHLEGVVDCPEFLVYFPLFVKLAESFGLMLMSRERFGRYFDKKKTNPEALSLMKKMNALEVYPSQDLMGEKEQYDFPERSLSDSVRSVGTMSSHEWEALNVYTVFAFKKIS